jgi:L-ascorbate metabolism protein UlaG (beta-lactamase superfamily)
MDIRYLGHAAFLLTTETGRKTTKIIMDPYEPGAFSGALGLGPIPDEADLVTVSHAHADHADAASLPGAPTVYREAGSFTVDGVTLRGIPTFHDSKQGQERGPNLVWAVCAESLCVCHLGDLGAVLDAGQVKSVGPIDVLLVPVGGTSTIDYVGAIKVIGMLKPRIAIPMHYRTPKVKLTLDYVENFLKELHEDRTKIVREMSGSDLLLTTKDLPKQGTEIVVLKPAL